MSLLNFEEAAKRLEKSDLKVPQSTVLFVDDEPQNLRIYQAMVHSEFEVITCTSGPEALKIIENEDRNQPIAAIVSDHIMPRMTGVELCTELRKRQHPATRIILTGFADLESAMTAVNEAAIFRFLTKPIDRDGFVKAVTAAVHLFEQKHEQGRLLTMIKGLMESNAELKKSLHAVAPDQLAAMNAAPVPETHARRLEIVALFSDVRGFTRMSAKLSPEKVIDSLQRIYEPMHRIIYECGGIVDKHMGDGLLAIFGLSGEFVNKAALQCLSNLVEATPSFYHGLPSECQDTKIAFGLAGGEVVCGSLGSMHRTELAVIGNCINRAARLQELTKQTLTNPGTVLGSFNKAMAICDEKLLVGGTGFRAVELSPDLVVRDFTDIRRVGLYSA